MQRISSANSQALYSVAATRQIENVAASVLPPHTLMQRAGLSIARLALALAPHAQKIWIACGPGNNGGDGFEAAMHLRQWGKNVVVSWTGSACNKALPPDAEASRQRAIAAGVAIQGDAPENFDFCVDALLGIGGVLDNSRPGNVMMLQWLDAMRSSGKPCLAVDLPTGLNADTGTTPQISTSGLTTLSLLTLKPGLFTAQGRDAAGAVWFDDLGVLPGAIPSAWLLGTDRTTSASRANASHASHKGVFGDVAVIGGESTSHSHMAGAALLAASAALHAGAGRVYVALLGDAIEPALTVDPQQPELMFRSVDALDLKQQTIVCGCGGGNAVKAVLPKLLSTAARLVLDADALNAIAGDTSLQTLLQARHGRGYRTVLTPHPLEAARLENLTTAQVQADRLKTAQQLADSFNTVVVLKGSGTVIAAPSEIPCINSSGNALLATAGTGDVLAGMLGAYMASGQDAFEAACSAVFAHGAVADGWMKRHPDEALVASSLARAVGA